MYFYPYRFYCTSPSPIDPYSLLPWPGIPEKVSRKFTLTLTLALVRPRQWYQLLVLCFECLCRCGRIVWVIPFSRTQHPRSHCSSNSKYQHYSKPHYYQTTPSLSLPQPPPPHHYHLIIASPPITTHLTSTVLYNSLASCRPRIKQHNLQRQLVFFHLSSLPALRKVTPVRTDRS